MTPKEQKQVRKHYYSDYVNHAVRFYLSTPETLPMGGKRKADIDNWLAVQDVWHRLDPEKKQVLEDVYRSHYRLSEGVRIYCEKTGAEEFDIMKLVYQTSVAIAKSRGLI